VKLAIREKKHWWAVAGFWVLLILSLAGRADNRFEFVSSRFLFSSEYGQEFRSPLYTLLQNLEASISFDGLLEHSLQANDQFAPFWKLWNGNYQENDASGLLRNICFMENCREYALYYNHQAQQFEPERGRGDSHFLRKTLGNRKMLLRIKKNKSNLHICREESLNHGGMGAGKMSRLLFLALSQLREPLRFCYAADRQSSLDSCIRRTMQANFPNVGKFFYTYFRFLPPPGSQRLKPGILDIKARILQSAMKKNFPLAYQKSAYTLKNISFMARMVTSNYRELGVINYDGATRTWHLILQPSFFQARAFKPWYIHLEGTINIYGIHATWKKLVLRYHSLGGANQATTTLDWYRNPTLEITGDPDDPVAGLGVALGGFKSQFQAYIDSLSGKAGPSYRPWRWILTEDNSISTSRVSFDIVSDPIEKFLFYKKKRRPQEIPSFAMFFIRSMANDLLLNLKREK